MTTPEQKEFGSTSSGLDESKLNAFVTTLVSKGWEDSEIQAAVDENVGELRWQAKAQPVTLGQQISAYPGAVKEAFQESIVDPAKVIGGKFKKYGEEVAVVDEPYAHIGAALKPFIPSSDVGFLERGARSLAGSFAGSTIGEGLSRPQITPGGLMAPDLSSLLPKEPGELSSEDYFTANAKVREGMQKVMTEPLFENPPETMLEILIQQGTGIAGVLPDFVAASKITGPLRGLRYLKNYPSIARSAHEASMFALVEARHGPKATAQGFLTGMFFSLGGFAPTRITRGLVNAQIGAVLGTLHDAGAEETLSQSILFGVLGLIHGGKREQAKRLMVDAGLKAEVAEAAVVSMEKLYANVESLSARTGRLRDAGEARSKKLDDVILREGEQIKMFEDVPERPPDISPVPIPPEIPTRLTEKPGEKLAEVPAPRPDTQEAPPETAEQIAEKYKALWQRLEQSPEEFIEAHPEIYSEKGIKLDVPEGISRADFFRKGGKGAVGLAASTVIPPKPKGPREIIKEVIPQSEVDAIAEAINSEFSEFRGMNADENPGMARLVRIAKSMMGKGGKFKADDVKYIGEQNTLLDTIDILERLVDEGAIPEDTIGRFFDKYSGVELVDFPPVSEVVNIAKSIAKTIPTPKPEVEVKLPPAYDREYAPQSSTGKNQALLKSMVSDGHILKEEANKILEEHQYSNDVLSFEQIEKLIEPSTSEKAIEKIPKRLSEEERDMEFGTFVPKSEGEKLLRDSDYVVTRIEWSGSQNGVLVLEDFSGGGKKRRMHFPILPDVIREVKESVKNHGDPDTIKSNLTKLEAMEARHDEVGARIDEESRIFAEERELEQGKPHTIEEGKAAVEAAQGEEVRQITEEAGKDPVEKLRTVYENAKAGGDMAKIARAANEIKRLADKYPDNEKVAALDGEVQLDLRELVPAEQPGAKTAKERSKEIEKEVGVGRTDSEFQLSYLELIRERRKLRKKGGDSKRIREINTELKKIYGDAALGLEEDSESNAINVYITHLPKGEKWVDTYLRWGRPPKGYGVSEGEEGVSAYKAKHNPDTGEYLITQGGKLWKLYREEGIKSEEGLYEVSGKLNTEESVGLDGEPVLDPKSVRLVRIVDPMNVELSLPSEIVVAQPVPDGKGGYRDEIEYGEKEPEAEDRGGYREAEVTPPKSAMTSEPMEGPEILELAKDVMGGKYPTVVKKIGKSGSIAHFSGDKGITVVNVLGKSPEEAAKSIAHEAGHAVDYFPQKTLSRGNVLGRLKSAKRHAKNEMVGILGTDKEIKKELIALSEDWKPYQEEAGVGAVVEQTKEQKKYQRYRESAKELYADAISVLFNDPAKLEKQAPKFYKAFMDQLGEKAEFKDLYEDMQRRLKSGGKIGGRLKGLSEMWEKGEERYAEKRGERRAGGKVQRFVENLYEDFVEEGASIIKLSKDARNAAEKIPYETGEFYNYMEGPAEVLKTLRDAGLTESDVDNVLFLERVIKERTDIFNPKNYTPGSAIDTLEGFKKTLGSKKAKAVDKAISLFRENRKDLIRKMGESGAFNEAQMKKVENNPVYATFDVLSDQITGEILRQEGTLHEIAPPFAATVLKDLAILRMLNKRKVVMEVVKALETEGVIKPAITKYDSEHKRRIPIPPKGDKWGMVQWLEDGKLEARYVPKEIAKSLNHDPYEARQYWRVLKFANSILRELYTGKNIGFMGFNIFRDAGNVYKQIPGMTVGKELRVYGKALVPGMKHAFGKEAGPLVREMREKGELMMPHSKWGFNAEDTQLESMLKDMEMMPKKYNKMVRIPLKIWDLIGRTVSVSEAVPKIATKIYLMENAKEMGLSEGDISHLVRVRGGSPNFLARGFQTDKSNNILLYSNAMIQGYRAAIEAARENPAEYTWKTAKATLMPKLLMYGASIGVMGLTSKRMMARVSDYDKTNYLIVPLGETESGKTVYLRIPQDETGRLIGGIFWKMLNGSEKKDMINLADYMAGQAPTLTTAITLPLDSLEYYMQGQNPYDRFKGRHVIPERIFDAGGKRSDRLFLKYVWNESGMGTFHRFKTDNLDEIQTELEEILRLPIMSNTLGRFLRVSDYGIAERIQMGQKEISSERRSVLLDRRDAMVEFINANGKVGIKEAKELYFKILKEEPALLEKRDGEEMSFRNFHARISELSSQSMGDAYLDGIIFARDGTEIVVFEIAKEQMGEKEYKEFVLKVGNLGLVSPAIMKQVKDRGLMPDEEQE